MRSLWRSIAAQWLGGAGSDALTGDSALAELLLSEQAAPVFRVARTREPCLPVIAPPPVPGAVVREDSDHPAGRRG